MIIVLRQGTGKKEIDQLSEAILKMASVTINPVIGTDLTILGLIGDTSRLDPTQIESFHCVERIMHVAEPYKKANRSFHPDDTLVRVGNAVVGGKKLAMIAGPCSVESREQITQIALSVQKSGASILRGGAFKPRTSPYAFQGLKYEGLELLKQAREASGLPIVSELMSPYDIDRFIDDVDCIQVGARNMQNFDLLRQLGKIQKPVLLKRGLSATIEEWLMSAEYIMAGGNEQVILCERGIRTFETYTRNTVDISAVPIVKRLSHLPVLVDPSHGTGKRWMVSPMTRAAIAVGADGVMIEVHNDPQRALCDGQQSITPDTFDEIMNDIRLIAQAVGREV
ncbi:MAG: 3-deoxy-7-phosphoheptulonate synthase [Clostridia bacterium]|nr:3-deoxy-7-phosphoheptulonate synthase [Clostridia bacterium]